LDAAIDFWERIRTSAIAQEEAAVMDPTIRQARAQGFDRGVDALMHGLSDAGLWDEGQRRVRAMLAYSQLQNVFHRWMRVGWDVDRCTMLEVMTDMWLAGYRTAQATLPPWLASWNNRTIRADLPPNGDIPPISLRYRLSHEF